MSKKKDKGKKMGLGEFLGKGYADENTGYLPRGPDLNREERDDKRGGGRYGRGGKDEGPFGRGGGGGREFEEEAPSAADEDNRWRRGPAPSSGSGMDPSRGSRANDQRGFGDYGASEEAGAQWRRGPPGADESEQAGSQWKRAPATSGSGTGFRDLRDRDNIPPRRSDADEVDHWRRGPAPSENHSSRADEESNWRRGPASSSSNDVQGETIRQSDSDNWRRGPIGSGAGAGAGAGAGVGTVKPAEEVDNWRKATPQPVDTMDSDNRPKLKLKKKGETETESEDKGSEKVHQTTEASTLKAESASGEGGTAEENNQDGEKLDKWAKLEKEMEAKRLAAEKVTATGGSNAPSASNGVFRRRMFGDNPMDSERENVFSRGFNKGHHRDRHDQRDNPGFAAFGSQNDRRGGFQDGGSARNNLFGAPRGERDNLRDPRGAYNNPAFSSGRDRDRDRERDASHSQSAYNNPVFGGGRDRDRDQEPREDRRQYSLQQRNEPPAPSKPVDLNAVFNVKSVKNWAGDSDSDSEDKADARPKLILKEKTKIMSDEEIFSHVTIILKDFFLMQRPKETLAEVKKVFEGQKYQIEFIRKIIVSCYGQDRAEVKAASNLLVKAKQEGMLKPEDISEAFEIVSTKLNKALGLDDSSDPKYTKAKDNLDTVSKIYKMLDSKSSLNGVTFGENTLKLLKIENKTAKSETDRTENSGSELVQMIDKLLSSGKKGSELVTAAQLQNTSKIEKGIVGIEFVKKLLATTSLCKEDQLASWVNKENYGGLLADCLYEEEPDAKQLEAQVNTLNEIQIAFNAVSFPRNAKGSSLLEKTFMELYKHEVISDEAFIAWKDVTDTPGKMDAIVQTSQFIAWLEEEEDSDEESDEE